MTTQTTTSPGQVMDRIVTEPGAGPLTAAEVAARTGLIEPYAREWPRAQAAAR